MTPRPGLSRRRFLQATGAVALGAAAGELGWLTRVGAAAASSGVRAPNSLPYPSLPAGQPTGAMPFDHIVVVMMENHSFDNYLGMLPARGQSAADGFTLAGGVPTNSNPYGDGYAWVTHATSMCQPVDVTQAWDATHEEIDNGQMDGFAKVDAGQMLYWDQSDIPFYYSLASTFTLANRWFCSAPCQTYPNRRFLLAGTASGVIATTTSTITTYPANGTIFDLLNTYGISWKDYYSDLPQAAIIFDSVVKYPGNLAPIADFFADCAAGSLPSVSFVDPEFGAAGDVAAPLQDVPIPGVPALGNQIATQSGDEENPADITIGETFVAKVVSAVMSSPAWPRTLLVWTYDEHGGYYDHVPPAPAIEPDSIQPDLSAGDYPGAYNIYGVRVPAVVVSPYSRAGAVTNVIHDHTSVLATIEAQWNLPALTYRDANAATLADFLDPAAAAFMTPPTLAAPGNLAASEAGCSEADPALTVRSSPGSGPLGSGSGAGGGASGSSGSTGASGSAGASAHLPRLRLRYRGLRTKLHGLVIELATLEGELRDVQVELRRGSVPIARTRVAAVGKAWKRVVLHPLAGRHLHAGHYELTISEAGVVLASRRIDVR
ncbi:MAG: alkaline phosphatase family protein [Solirubrobacteraceae bacterium]